MSLSYKAMVAGIPQQQIQALIQDVATGLTATGTNQATAYAMDFNSNQFSTVDANTGARLSSNAVGGDSQLVYNGGANTLKVYPPSGAALNGLAANQPDILPIRTACRYECLTTTLWTGLRSA